MELKGELFKELIKQGPSIEGGRRIWNIAKRDFLFGTPELAKGFLKLRTHKRYEEIVVQKEIEMLGKHKEVIFNELNNGNFNLIDLGCGNGTKAKSLLSSFSNIKSMIRYAPVNVDQYLVNLALENVKNEGFLHVKEFSPLLSGFESLDEVVTNLRSSNYPRNIVLLLGSILANFDIHNYLFNLSNAMFEGDVLLIGNGIRKGERLVNIEAYKHPAFNEWFILLMKELGFEESEVEYGVRFNEMRVEGFYKIKNDKEIEYNGKKVSFKAGDEILIAILYKFYDKELLDFCKMYFCDVKLFKDTDDEYALLLCRK